MSLLLCIAASRGVLDRFARLALWRSQQADLANLPSQVELCLLRVLCRKHIYLCMSSCSSCARIHSAGRRCRLQRAVGSANLCWCLSSLLADVRICQCIVHPGNALRQKGEGLPGCELYSPVIWGCLPALLRDLRSDADLRR